MPGFATEHDAVEGGSMIPAELTDGTKGHYTPDMLKAASGPSVSSMSAAKTKIMAGAADVTILFIGDSHGDATDEWIYLFAVWLSEQYPTHTVEYSLWNEGTTDYAAATTIATGSGARTIHVYNASAGGFHIGRWMTGRYATAIGALTPDLILTNDGVNLYTSAVQDIRRRYAAAIQQILTDKPNTPIAITLQMAFRDDNNMDNIIEALRQVASDYTGITLIDAHARFVEAGKPSGYYANNTHPSATGSLVTLAEAQRHWTSARDRPPVDAFASWWADRATFNLLRNGDLADFDAEVPDHWGSATISSVSKDLVTVYPGKTHSVKLTGANKLLSYKIEKEALKSLRGKRLVVAVRVYAETGGDAGTGKFYVTVDGSLTNKMSVNIGNTEGNGWQWQIVDKIDVPVTATSVEVVLTSSGSGVTSGTAYFDEVILYDGDLKPEWSATERSTEDNPSPVINLYQDGGRFGSLPEAQATAVGTFGAPAYISAANSAVIAAGPRFIFNNNDFGGSSGALDADVLSLTQKIKDTVASSGVYGRYGVEYYLLQITAGAGTSTSRTIEGVTHYLAFSTYSAPLPLQFSWNAMILTKSGSVGVDLTSTERMYLDGRRQRIARVIEAADGWKQVTRLFDIPSDLSMGYNNIFPGIFATPGSVFYLAMPCLAAGLIKTAPEYYHGVVMSAQAWR